jgi:tetratricopeptide (TPR) repeat protein
MMRKHFLLLGLAIALMGALRVHGSAATDDAYVREGYTAAISRDWDQAVAQYTKAVTLNPRNVDAYFLRGVAREMSNHIDQAIEDYKETLELQPQYYLAMEYLARLYETKGDYAKAVDLYARALPLTTDPKWQSMVRWWMSEAKRKMQGDPAVESTPHEPRSRQRGQDRARR